MRLERHAPLSPSKTSIHLNQERHTYTIQRYDAYSSIYPVDSYYKAFLDIMICVKCFLLRLTSIFFGRHVNPLCKCGMYLTETHQHKNKNASRNKHKCIKKNMERNEQRKEGRNEARKEEEARKEGR